MRPLTAPVVTGFDVPSLLSVLQPMTHSTAGRIPLFAWDLPMPSSESYEQARADGTLRQYVDQLVNRGIVPTVWIGNYGASSSQAEEVALAETIQEAQLPVYLVFPQNGLIESTVWQKNTVWSWGPDASQRGRWRRWPCLPLADGSIGASWVRQQLLPLQQAGIKVAGAWFDDESLPHPWNGVYESQRDNPQCRPYYPAGVLDNYSAFQVYAYGLRAKLDTQVMADPVHQLFPGAIVGNFAEAISTASSPYLALGTTAMPAYDMGGMDTMMPMLYPQFLGIPSSDTQQQADATMFRQLLSAESTAAANKGSKRLVPYLSIYATAPYVPGKVMSSSARKELMWHMFLRGTDSLALFNLGRNGSNVTPEQSLQFLEDARSVYDQVLAFRPFLDGGTPMNLLVPDITKGAAIWSGLKLGNQALIRAWSPTSATQKVAVEAFPGVTVTLAATSQGALYLVGSDGSVRSAQA